MKFSNDMSYSKTRNIGYTLVRLRIVKGCEITMDYPPMQYTATAVNNIIDTFLANVKILMR